MTKRLYAFASAGAALAALSYAGRAHADPFDRGALEALFDEPVTLSATGAPQRVTDAPVNMTIITQEEIRRSGALDIPGVLETLAPVDVMRSMTGQADASVRGYNMTLAPRLLVLVNGRQVYMDDFGKTAWDSIPVQLGEIRQIEIVLGPNTALFGFNAVAGVVNIVTYDPLQDHVNQISLKAGAPGYLQGSAIWSTRPAANVGVRLSLGGLSEQSTHLDDALAAGSFAEPQDPNARTAALNVGYDASADLRFDMEATWVRSRRIARLLNNSFFDPYDNTSVKFGFSDAMASGLLQGQVYLNAIDANQREVRTSVASLAWVTRVASAHTIRIAGEYRHNAMHQFGSIAYDVEALSGMWNWQATPELALTSAARIDALQLGRSGPFSDPAFPFVNSDFDRSFTQWSYNFGAVYRPTERDSLRFSTARGVGLPSLIDFGFDYKFTAPGLVNFVGGDPSLDPEIVYNTEIGWDHDLPGIGGRLRAAAYYQRNESFRLFGMGRRVLSVFPVLTIINLPQNVGDSDMYGLDLALNGKAGRFDWRAGLSHRSFDDDLTVSPAIVQDDFAHTSPHDIATAGVTWVGERFEWGGDLRYTGRTHQYGQGATLVGEHAVDSYVQLNGRAAWKLTPALEVDLLGRDLLAPRTQTVGVVPVRRTFVLSLTSSF